MQPKDLVVDIGSNVKLQMKYPTYDALTKFGGEGDEVVKATFDMIKVCVDQVIVGEDEVHQFKDYSESEVDNFVDSLTSKGFADVQGFSKIQSGGKSQARSEAETVRRKTCSKKGAQNKQRT